MLDLTVFLTLPKKEIIRMIQKTPLPGGGMMRAALAGVVAGVSDADFVRWTGIIGRGIAALSETDNGRAVLADLGIAPCDCSN